MAHLVTVLLGTFSGFGKKNFFFLYINKLYFLMQF